MGIKLLLPLLENGMKDTCLESLVGKVAAIDVSIWIYQSLYTFKNPIQIVYNRTQLLLDLGIRPILVMDGCTPEAKSETREKRKRNENTEQVRNALGQNFKNGKWQSHLHESIKEFCLQRRIAYIISPFEADAQLTFLITKGLCDIVITEDSDLIAFGCPKILFKLRKGKGMMLEQSSIENCLDAPFDITCFQAICIAMGSDYFPGGVYEVGAKRAKKLFQKLNGTFNYNKFVRQLQKVSGVRCGNDFRRNFQQALDTFKYQLVLDPTSQTIVPLNPYEDGKSHLDYPFAGTMEEANIDHWFPPAEEPLPTPRIQLSINYVSSYICRNCEATFPTRDELCLHRAANHRHFCTICNKSFKNATTLRYHQDCHDDVPRHCCEICGAGFYTTYAKYSHKRSVHVAKTFVCSFCQRGFKTEQCLNNHLLVHVPQPRAMCDICGKDFRENRALSNHMHESHSQQDPVWCDICNKRFKNKRVLGNHKKKVHGGRVRCSICQKDFATIPSMTRHLRNVHRATTPSITRHLIILQRATIPSITTHLRNVHRVAPPRKTFSPPMLKCLICHQTFKTNADKKQHFKNAHLHNGKVECHICHQTFKTPTNLKKHLNDVHFYTNAKIHCPTCRIHFTRESNLRQHLKKGCSTPFSN